MADGRVGRYPRPPAAVRASAPEPRPAMRTEGLPTLAPAFQAATSAAELRAGGAPRGERFADFSAFAAAGEGQVGLGRERASIDAVHAARTVAGFLVEG